LLLLLRAAFRAILFIVNELVSKLVSLVGIPTLSSCHW